MTFKWDLYSTSCFKYEIKYKVVHTSTTFLQYFTVKLYLLFL